MAGEEVEGAPKPALGCRLYTWERGVWEREGRSGVPRSAIRLAAKEQPGGHLGTGMGVGGLLSDWLHRDRDRSLPSGQGSPPAHLPHQGPGRKHQAGALVGGAWGVGSSRNTALRPGKKQ